VLDVLDVLDVLVADVLDVTDVLVADVLVGSDTVAIEATPRCLMCLILVCIGAGVTNPHTAGMAQSMYAHAYSRSIVRSIPTVADLTADCRDCRDCRAADCTLTRLAARCVSDSRCRWLSLSLTLRSTGTHGRTD
jgi:hypothetical protein